MSDASVLRISCAQSHLFGRSEVNFDTSYPKSLNHPTPTLSFPCTHDCYLLTTFLHYSSSTSRDVGAKIPIMLYGRPLWVFLAADSSLRRMGQPYATLHEARTDSPGFSAFSNKPGTLKSTHLLAPYPSIPSKSFHQAMSTRILRPPPRPERKRDRQEAPAGGWRYELDAVVWQSRRHCHHSCWVGFTTKITRANRTTWMRHTINKCRLHCAVSGCGTYKPLLRVGCIDHLSSIRWYLSRSTARLVDFRRTTRPLCTRSEFSRWMTQHKLRGSQPATGWSPFDGSYLEEQQIISAARCLFSLTGRQISAKTGFETLRWA